MVVAVINVCYYYYYYYSPALTDRGFLQHTAKTTQFYMFTLVLDC